MRGPNRVRLPWFVARARRAAVVFVALVATGSQGCHQDRLDATPVILISIDTTRRDHCSLYGYDRPTTPNLEQLARDGVVFEQAIAAHTNTAPSHATMLSGLPPIAHGSLNNGVPIGDSIDTLAEYLGRAGYATGAFVSGATLKAKQCGLQRGFDVYDDIMARRRWSEKTYGRARAWLAARSAETKAIFLFFHSYDPHGPYRARKQFARFGLADGEPVPAPHGKVKELRDKAREQGLDSIAADIASAVRTYDAAIAHTDYIVGQLLAQLQALGLYDRALIIATSDHGETLGDRPWVLGHGARITDEQVRVPLVIKLPGNVYAGRRVADQVAHVDFYRTVLDVLRMRVPDRVEGRSLFPLMRGESAPTEPAFSLARREPHRLRDVGVTVPSRGKIGTRSALIAAVRLPDHKLIDYSALERPAGSEVLHDLAHDPSETRNVLDEQGEVADTLRELLQLWWRAPGRRDGTRTEITDEVREELRALGYVQ